MVDTEVKKETGVCDSCGQVRPLNEVSHHQEGNDKVWKYCNLCKKAHDKEVYTNECLKELAKTNPAEANNPAVANLFQQGKTVEEVKKDLSQ